MMGPSSTAFVPLSYAHNFYTFISYDHSLNSMEIINMNRDFYCVELTCISRKHKGGMVQEVGRTNDACI